jgi:hypothetical protein
MFYGGRNWFDVWERVVWGSLFLAAFVFLLALYLTVFRSTVQTARKTVFSYVIAVAMLFTISALLIVVGVPYSLVRCDSPGPMLSDVVPPVECDSFYEKSFWTTPREDLHWIQLRM